jgi:hypothetical protein
MRSAVGCAALAASLVLCTACGTSPSSTSTSPSDPNIITYEDLEQHRFTNVYEAIQALRSNWLVPRGPDSFRTPSEVKVRYDDTELGGVETLRAIAIQSVVYIRYYNGVDATARWGLDHGAGVIFVSSRNPPRSERTPPDTGVTLRH